MTFARFHVADRPSRSEVLKNVAISGGALGVGYGGYRAGRAANKVSEAAEAWKKSSPSHIVKSASSKLRGLYDRIATKVPGILRAKQMLNLIAKGHVHQFAKPGEMFRKYNPDSPFVTDAIGKDLFKAATTRTKSKMRKDYTYPRANENFSKRAMREADIRTNLEGMHDDFLNKKSDLLSEQSAAKKAGKTLPTITESVPVRRNIGESAIKDIEHKIKRSKAEGTVAPPSEASISRTITPKEQTQKFVRQYTKEVHSNRGAWRGYGFGLNRKRANIRKAAAEEFKATREILQAHRRAKGTLPKPLSDKKMAKVLSRKVRIPATKANAPERIWHHGMSDRTVTEVRGHIPLAGTWVSRSEYAKGLSGIKGKLESEITDKVTRSANKGLRLDKMLRSRAGRTIQGLRKSNNLTPYTESQLGGEVRKTVHEIYNPVAPSGIKRENIAARLGMSPNRLDAVRTIHERNAIFNQSHAGAQAIRKQILSQPGFFKSTFSKTRTRVPRVKITEKGFPALKKLGIAGGIGAAAVGAGILAKRLYDNKKERQFSIPTPLLVAATGGTIVGASTLGILLSDKNRRNQISKELHDSRWWSNMRGILHSRDTRKSAHSQLQRPYQKNRIRDASKEGLSVKFEQKKTEEDSSNFTRDVAVGGIEGGAGYLATDHLISKLATNMSRPARFGLAAGVGGLATGTIGYGLNRIIGNKIKQRRAAQQQFSSKIEFKVSRSGNRVLHDGTKVDISALINAVGDRAAKRIKIKSLKPMSYTKKSGYSERRVTKANTSKPILIYGREVLDGRHRITKKQRLGHTTVNAIKVTAKDLKAVKMRSKILSEIRLDAGYNTLYPPKPGKRVTVVQDRYRKKIKEQEINRHESNVAKAAVAGGALGHLVARRPLIGAGLGAGAEAALILSDRKKRDAFGDSSIATRRVERLPYQVAGLAATGLLAKKIYKHFSDPSNIITFDRKRWDQMSTVERLAKNPERAQEEIGQHVNRAYKLGRDIVTPGKKSIDRITDERGRERTPEWAKPWAVKGAIGLGVAALIGKRRIANLFRDAPSVIKTAARRHPKLARMHGRARGFMRQVGHEKDRLIDKITGTSSATEAEILAKEHEAADAAKEAEANEKSRRDKFRNIIEGNFSSKTKTIRFAQSVPSWDIRDARGKSARVYAPGSQRRMRRGKKWHEKKSNRDLLAAGITAAALGTGAGASPLYKRFLGKHEVPVKPVAPNTANVEGIIGGQAVKKIVKESKNVFDLNSRIDQIAFAGKPRKDSKAKWGAISGGVGGAVGGGSIGAYAAAFHPDAISAYMGHSTKGMSRGIHDILDTLNDSVGENWKPKHEEADPFGRGKFTEAERAARQSHVEHELLKSKALRRIGKWSAIGALGLGSLGALSGYAASRAGIHHENAQHRLSSLLASILTT